MFLGRRRGEVEPPPVAAIATACRLLQPVFEFKVSFCADGDLFGQWETARPPQRKAKAAALIAN